MSSAVPPLFLHIGRGKSGSSTIQSLAGDHAPFMKAQGIICPLTVHGMANHARLASALYEPQSDPSTLRKFRRDVGKYQKAKVFISAEALFSLNRQSLEHLKRLIRGRETRILSYVRDYPNWLQSVYAQRTKRAVNTLSFDEYYQVTRNATSVLPRLDRWADAFGWEMMRVRPLDAASLVGGDLISDVLHSLGVDTLPGDVESLNVTPHWIALELLRAVVLAAKAESIVLDPRTARVTRALFESCTANVKPHRAQYFTKEQWRDLAELYKSDIEALSKRTNVPLNITLREPDERPFLPDFSAIPERVKIDVSDKLNQPPHSDRIPPDVLALVRRVLDR